MTAFEPATLDEMQTILREAVVARRPVVPIGARTSIDPMPATARAAALLSTRALPGGIDHVAGDLVATIAAGASLGDVNQTLAREGQCLPLDPPFADRATIGGIVAANASGPRRHRYGAPRDLIIGITIVLPDGRLAKAGGRVVKNVAGYDLSRLLCGSFGCLAVIAGATFKLSPVAPASRTLVATVTNQARFGELLQALVQAPITPSTIELAAPPCRLLIRFETTATAADRMADTARAVCAKQGATTAIVTDADEAALWQTTERNVWEGAGTIVTCSVLPTEVPYIVGEIASACAANGVTWHAAGRAALGIIVVRLEGDAGVVASLLADWRHRATVRGGSLVVQRPAPGLEHVSRWGDAPSAAAMMRAVKAQFDPYGILSPGMGPGGL